MQLVLNPMGSLPNKVSLILNILTTISSHLVHLNALIYHLLSTWPDNLDVSVYGLYARLLLVSECQGCHRFGGLNLCNESEYRHVKPHKVLCTPYQMNMLLMDAMPAFPNILHL